MKVESNRAYIPKKLTYLSEQRAKNASLASDHAAVEKLC